MQLKITCSSLNDNRKLAAFAWVSPDRLDSASSSFSRPSLRLRISLMQ